MERGRVGFVLDRVGFFFSFFNYTKKKKKKGLSEKINHTVPTSIKKNCRMPSLTKRSSYQAARKLFCLQKKIKLSEVEAPNHQQQSPLDKYAHRDLYPVLLWTLPRPHIWFPSKSPGWWTYLLAELHTRHNPGAKHGWLGGWNDSLWQLWIYQTQKSSLRKFLKTSDIWLSPHRGNIPFEDIWGFNTALTIISRMVNVFKGIPGPNVATFSGSQASSHRVILNTSINHYVHYLL